MGSVRTAQLSIFGHDNAPSLLVANLWRHAAMFHYKGGLYARDNFPGLPMMDVITSLLFLAGLLLLLRRLDLPLARLLLCLLAINMAAGVFSVSQEGAPYVYRASAAMIPAFLIGVTGLLWFVGLTERLRNWKRVRWSPVTLMLPALVLNAWLYFGLESQNRAATRVMDYEVRLVAREFAGTDRPVYVVGTDLFDRAEPAHYPDERHAESNPTFKISPSLAMAAVFSQSPRFALSEPYDAAPAKTAPPHSIRLVEPMNWFTLSEPYRAQLAKMARQHWVPLERIDSLPLPEPAVFIFNIRNKRVLARLRKRDPDCAIRILYDPAGRPLIGVAEIGNPA